MVSGGRTGAATLGGRGKASTVIVAKESNMAGVAIGTKGAGGKMVAAKTLASAAAITAGIYQQKELMATRGIGQPGGRAGAISAQSFGGAAGCGALRAAAAAA